MLVRHGESLGNVDDTAYTRIPDPQIPLTERGCKQAQLAGANVVQIMDDNTESPREGMPCAYFILSPYRRSKETFENMSMAFSRGQVVGAQEEVQLREQDVRVLCDAAAKVLVPKLLAARSCVCARSVGEPTLNRLCRSCFHPRGCGDGKHSVAWRTCGQ